MASPNSRVLIDTNILISALITPKGIPNKIIKWWYNNRFILITSNQLIEETKQVLLRTSIGKLFNLSSETVEEIITLLKISSEVVKPIPIKRLTILCRDRKDNIVLASALGGKAQYLVTGDKDLLILNDNKKLVNILILSPKQFLKHFDK